MSIVHTRKSFERRPIHAAENDVLIVTDTGEICYRNGSRWITVVRPMPVPIRAMLAAERWTRVTFPGKHLEIPNYSLKLWKISNSQLVEIHSYEIRELSNTGFEILTGEECAMDLTVHGITNEMTVYIQEVSV